MHSPHARAHTHTHRNPRSEAYIKVLGKYSHNDRFLQMGFGLVRKEKEKMGSFAGSYQLTHGKGSFEALMGRR